MSPASSWIRAISSIDDCAVGVMMICRALALTPRCSTRCRSNADCSAP
jgi:hypothetical protein